MYITLLFMDFLTGYFLNWFQNHAFPADELMPISCKGRHRGTKPSRGDMDEVLGKYVLFE